MKNIFPFPVKLTAVSEGMTSLHDFLKTSYHEKREWLAESIAFLKDFTQMEEEFQRELTKTNEFCICIEGEMLSENEILSRPMEENY